MHDILWKFRGKQCIKKEGLKILLKYLLCKEKLIEAIDDVIETILYEFVIDYGYLGEIVKKPLALGCTTVKNL